MQDIGDWTTEHFGGAQAKLYTQTILEALKALRAGPQILGAKPRYDLAPGLVSLHVARNQRKGRHVVIFRVIEDGIIEVVRILHDSMDIPRHVARPAESRNGDKI